MKRSRIESESVSSSTTIAVIEKDDADGDDCANEKEEQKQMMTVDNGNVTTRKTKIPFDSQQSITPHPSLLMLVKAVDAVLSPTDRAPQLSEKNKNPRRPTLLPRSTTTIVTARGPIVMNHVQYKKTYDDSSTDISSYPSIEHHQHHYGDQVIAIERKTQKKKGRLLSSTSTSNSGLLVETVSPLFAPPPLLSGLQPGEIRA
jgi:hypothetical protein